MKYFCCDDRRRGDLLDPRATLNGIDFLDVIDHDAATEEERQRKLVLHFVKPLAAVLTNDNIVIEGGERITGIRVLEVKPGDAADAVVVSVDRAGDYSTYTLRLVDRSNTDLPPQGIDPVLSSVDFSFKIECGSEFDCAPRRLCPTAAGAEPEIDYLAKDYASFRRLMLNRLAVLTPDWQGRDQAADLGLTLVELLAYVGDRLSYEQDAIATEAYLGTARRRVSVRRHTRLVDYTMHEGCNARAWVRFEISVPFAPVKQGTQLMTQVPGVPVVLKPDTIEYREAIGAQPEFFELMHDAKLYQAHNVMRFYTWGNRECCLPKGATSAHLAGGFPDLQAGDVLIFEELLGPRSGAAADADPQHRHAVRLLSVDSVDDPLFADPHDSTKPLPVTRITWSDADALPFALCVSARTDSGEYVEEVSIARGNVVLADHGRRYRGEPLGAPPPADPVLAPVAPITGDRCRRAPVAIVPPDFRPVLCEQPLTHLGVIGQTAEGRRLPFDPAAPATAAFQWAVAPALPDVRVTDDNNRTWLPQADLLSSAPFAEDFVAEMDDGGRATLRFGDDQYGMRPTPNVNMKAEYRVGNGTRGNVGAGALAHVVTDDDALGSAIEFVTNPMPARGGVDPEPVEHARQHAPSAFRVQQRAVTADDYAEVAQRHPEVQRAAATLRWTGSWLTVFLTVDRVGGGPIDADFEARLRQHIEAYRMAGHDLEIDGPDYIALEIELAVCVAPGYFRSEVKAALLQALGSGVLPDGTRGFFHPDNFTFAQPVYLSALYAAAQAVTGVRFVEFTTLQRLGSPATSGLRDGFLAMERLEIARLDNDPNAPEHGVLRVLTEGGK